MLGLQLLTGAGRPDETHESSEWQPFQDNNGVSGHSFMGAIPFMSAAKMTDNLWLKGSLYAASTIPGISRINDDRHYFSQVMLGWWLAYLAESAVDHSHNPNANQRFFVCPNPGGIGVGHHERPTRRQVQRRDPFGRIRPRGTVGGSLALQDAIQTRRPPDGNRRFP